MVVVFCKMVDWWCQCVLQDIEDEEFGVLGLDSGGFLVWGGGSCSGSVGGGGSGFLFFQCGG